MAGTVVVLYFVVVATVSDSDGVSISRIVFGSIIGYGCKAHFPHIVFYESVGWSSIRSGVVRVIQRALNVELNLRNSDIIARVGSEAGRIADVKRRSICRSSH